MSKNKLKKFAEMETYTHVFQLSYNELAAGATFDLKGRWHEHFFGNTNPIVIELGCGRGEYTIGLAERFPDSFDGSLPAHHSGTFWKRHQIRGNRLPPKRHKPFLRQALQENTLQDIRANRHQIRRFSGNAAAWQGG